MVETLVQQGRGADWTWNTQDLGTAVSALAEFQRHQKAGVARGVRVAAGKKAVFDVHSLGAESETSVSLDRLPAGAMAGGKLRLSLTAGDTAHDAGPVFYFLTTTIVPRRAPVRPADRGMQVERWYEEFESGRPITEIAEGELVRVRLRLTVPSERHFVILDDALPAGLEAVDLSLRTVGGVAGPGAADSAGVEGEGGGAMLWVYGSWDSGWWSPFDHREMRDDRVVFAATRLWPGSYSATYVARATTPGTFARPPAHAEEMYNPAVFGESDGGVFTVRSAGP
jgi:uncharacterized protein YfaS (alpha-2-macroglobulin family)